MCTRVYVSVLSHIRYVLGVHAVCITQGTLISASTVYRVLFH